jgi:sugar (pentulose or hexulose) kinase
MWLVQQSMQTWANQGKTFTYEQLNGLASQAKPFISLIDPDDSLFLPAGDMPSHIREFCARTQQPLPQDEGHIMRTIYESLAMKYRFVLEKLASLAGQEIKCLHIIGGGSQNTLLCQMTADAIGREVVAGPVEATALGNAIVQLITLGEFGTVAQAREVVQQSFPLVHYAPQNTSAWDEAYGRFKGLITST